MLRLLGYKVERNLSVNGCQIDILAEYRTGIIPLRLLVECKDYSDHRHVGIEEINKFAGILHSAKRAIDKGLIVTTFGYTREAKHFASTAGIELVTFADLSTQLVNFDDYIERLIADFERSRVFRYYVNLSGSFSEDYQLSEDATIKQPLTDLVEQFSVDPRRNKLALLGNFGTGKSTFCHKYAHDLASRYQKDSTGRIPIVVSLSEYESKLDIQELITNTLQFRHGVRIDIVLCEELQRLGKFMLILDGFDEMATRVDPDMIRDNLREISKITRIPENKVILTCRTHFCRDRIQAEILADFDIVYIPEWGEEELAIYLHKYFGDTWNNQLQQIHDTHNLAELAQTPLFLEMIVETLPALTEEVRRVELYRAYTDRWIKQQSERRGARLNSNERVQFVTELAIKLYVEDKVSCHYSELTPILRQRFEIDDAAQMDYLHSDIRSCTFLTRDPTGYYGFRHKSFMEYFVAQVLANQIRKNSLELLSAKLLPLEVTRFVVDILRTETPKDILMAWIQTVEHEIARQNLLLLVARLKIDVSTAKLEGDASKDSEIKLAAQFVQGDTRAFDELYAEYRGLLTHFVRMKLGVESEPADDIVAEVFLSMWLHRDRLEKITDLRSYLIAVAKNRCVDIVRSRNRGIDSTQIEGLQVASGEAQKMETKVILTEVLQRLPELERNVIEKVYIEGKSLADVADEFHITVSSVRSLNRGAIRELRQLLRSAGKGTIV